MLGMSAVRQESSLCHLVLPLLWDSRVEMELLITVAIAVGVGSDKLG